MNDCLNRLMDSHGDKLTRREIGEIVRDINAKKEAAVRAGEFDVEGYVLKLAKKELEEAEFNKVKAKRMALVQRKKIAQTTNYVTTNWDDSPHTGLEARLIGMYRNREGARDSVYLDAQVKTGDYLNKLVYNLDDADPSYWKQLQKHTLDDEIADAIVTIHANDKVKLDGMDQSAVNIAKVVDSIGDLTIAESNQHGAFVGKYNGYAMRNAHDSGRIKKAGDKAWIDFFFKDTPLNFHRTFGTQDEAVIRKILGDLHAELSRGVHVYEDFGDIMARVMRNVPGANIGNSLSHHRGFHWNSGKAALDYQRQFGMGTLIEAVTATLQTKGRSVGIMMKMGPGIPKNVFEEMRNDLVRHYEAKGNKEAVDKLMDKDWNKSMNGHLSRITGELNDPVNQTMATINTAIGMHDMVTKLGGVAASVMPDFANGMLAAHASGQSPLKTLGRQLASQVRASGDQIRYARAAGAMLDFTIRSFADVTDGAGRPGVMAYSAKVFMSATGLTHITERSRVGYVWGRIVDQAAHADRAFKDLPVDLQRELRGHNLQDSWDVIRQAVRKVDDGTEIISTEDIADKDVAFRYQAFNRDYSNSAVLEPGPRTKAITRGTARAGTVEHMLVSMVMRFKSYMIAVFENVLGKTMTERSDKIGFWEAAGDSYKSWAIPLVGYAITTTGLGYLSLVMKDIMKNRTPRELNGTSIMQAFVQGGGGGILGDFLMGEGLKNRHGGSFATTLMGPTAGTISGIADLWGRIRDGDDTASAAFKTLYSNLPANNLWFIKAPLEIMLLNGFYEHLNPGYTARQRKRLEELGQTPLFE